MGEEGFSSDSSLLYHRGVPSAIVDSEVWELPDQTRTPNHPLKPRHLKLHDAVPGADGDRRRTRSTGRRLVLGNNDVRIALRRHRHRPLPALPQRDRRRVRLRRVRQRHRRDGLRRRAPTAPATTCSIPRATDHRWVPARAEPALPDRGQQPHRPAEALPLALRAAARARAVLRARPARPRRAAARRSRATDVEVLVKHRTGGRRRRHPADLRDAPVRRGRLGRLPLPLHVQRRGLHADHRQGPPAAAGAPGLRGPQLRGLQLPAAQGRLPPAVDPGALLPLQRRQRRGHVLRRRRLRGAQGLGHQHRLDLAAPRRPRPRAAAQRDRGVARARSTSTSRPSWSTPSPRSTSARAGVAAEDPAYAWTWAGRGPRRRPERRDGDGGPAVYSNS